MITASVSMSLCPCVLCLCVLCLWIRKQHPNHHVSMSTRLSARSLLYDVGMSHQHDDTEVAIHHHLALIDH